MGLGHRLDEFLAAALKLSDCRSLCWAFAGSGNRQDEVRRFAQAHPQARIERLPYVARGELAAHLASGDIHLMSMRREWTGCILPSKLQAAFVVGRPVIFVGPADSSPARWIRESGGGWVVAENDVDGLVAAVREALDAPERNARGRRARRYSEAHFDLATNCARIGEMIEKAAQ